MIPFDLVMTLLSRFACFRLLGTFQMLNGPKLFATSFFREIEDREKKKSMGNVRRWELGPTTWARKLTMRIHKTDLKTARI
jgi:hypothetical protein